MLGIAWALRLSGHLDSTSWFSRGVCAPTRDLLITDWGKVSRVCPVLRDVCGAGWGIILLWGPRFSPPLSPGSLDVLFFPSRIRDLLPAPGMGLLGRRWATAAVGLPSQNLVSNIPPPPLTGDAGGRLGGWQNLLAGAVQRWRFPRRQLHLHGWNRLQGKCPGAAFVPGRGS